MSSGDCSAMEMTNVAMEYSDPVFTPPRLGWQSPRISFCRDIPGDIVSPEKRKREEIMDNYSTKFEFYMVENVTDPAFLGQGMISADELFLDGKLLPLHIPLQTPPQEMDNGTPEDLENTTHAISADLEPEVEDETQSISFPGCEPRECAILCRLWFKHNTCFSQITQIGS